jgi:hypothetical protein
MGQHVADTHFATHGSESTAFPKDVRLHYGDKAIDETHQMTDQLFRSLVYLRQSSQQTVFEGQFGFWLDSNASTSAKTHKTAFTAAAWRAL